MNTINLDEEIIDNDYQKTAAKFGIFLPRFEEVSLWKQIVSYVCLVLSVLALILLVMLPLPYNSPLMHPNTNTLFKSAEIIALFETLMLSLSLNFYLIHKVSYQMTYRDGIKMIRKMEKLSLINPIVGNMICAMIWEEKKKNTREKEKYADQARNYIKKHFENKNVVSELEAYIEKLEKENASLYEVKKIYDEIKREEEDEAKDI